MAAVAVLLVAVVVQWMEKEKNSPRTLRIGMAVYLQTDTFINALAQEFEQLAQQAETEHQLKINLSIVDARGSQFTQNEQIDRFVAMDYDVLCVNIVDRTAAAMLIDKAMEADIPIIFFNREPVQEDISRWDKVYYVGAPAEDSGILQGEMILNVWNRAPQDVDKNQDGILQYVMLEGEPGHQDTLLRTEYSVQTLTKAGLEVEKLASNTANWDRGQAQARMTEWLEEFGGEIEAVISNNDDMALGALDALEEAGIAQADFPVVVGVDATEAALKAIQSGKMEGTVHNDAAGIAKSLLDLSLKTAQLQQPETDNANRYVWLPYYKITADNLPQK